MNWLQKIQDAINWGNTLGSELCKASHFGNLLLLAIVTAIVSGLGLYLLDPNIRTLFDGIWSAWVTMTHVGYGDVVPVSFAGRLLAALLILFGLVFFSVFTALVSVTLLGKTFADLGGSVRHMELDTTRRDDRQELILAELQRLHGRLDAWQAQTSAGSAEVGR